MKIRSNRSDINRPRPRNGHKYTKYKMSQHNDGYVLSKTSVIFKAQFIKKLSKPVAELKKKL